MSTLSDEYFRQRSDLVEASLTPRTVIFSHPGFHKAMGEESPGMHHFSNPPQDVPRTYCALPYVIDRNATAELVVTHEAPELVAQRLTASAQARHRQRQGAVTLKMAGLTGDTTAEIVGSKLNAAQLCDIIRAFLDADDATHWGKFERALDATLIKYGRFE
jgi:hypothetical protein